MATDVRMYIPYHEGSEDPTEGCSREIHIDRLRRRWRSLGLAMPIAWDSDADRLRGAAVGDTEGNGAAMTIARKRKR